MNYIVLHSF